jgi:SAM-dependent methyltransferase
VVAAKRIARMLGVPFRGVVGDARFMPFRRDSFDAAFSYSVLQHFSKPDARLTLEEINRVLRPDGKLLIQMASAFGLRSLQYQLRRGFREAKDFEVRYWTPRELLELFGELFGRTELQVDCYFGLGLQATDLRLMSRSKQAIILLSEALKKVSKTLSPLAYAADSVYLKRF